MPLSTPEKEGFKTFAKAAAPLWKVPSRKKLTGLVDNKYENLKAEIKDFIKDLPEMSLTFDGWTDTHTKTSYLGGTLHFRNGNKLELITLSVTELKESHTSIYLELVIEDILLEWNIDKNKVTVLVTDNAANIQKAVHAVFGEDKCIPCFDHTLNLIPDYAIKKDSKGNPRVPELLELISKVKNIVSFINSSTTAAGRLKQMQIDKGKTEGTVLHLVQEVSTRWSSTFFMIVRFLELADLLSQILLDYEKLTMLNGSELKTLRQVAQILQPLQVATEEMSADSETTTSKVVPIVSMLKKVNS